MAIFATTKNARRYYTLYEQKLSNMRPLLSITFPKELHHMEVTRYIVHMASILPLSCPSKSIYFFLKIWTLRCQQQVHTVDTRFTFPNCNPRSYLLFFILCCAFLTLFVVSGITLFGTLKTFFSLFVTFYSFILETLGTF